MTALLDKPPGFFVVAMAVILTLLAIAGLCRAILALARDWREYRRGR